MFAPLNIMRTMVETVEGDSKTEVEALLKAQFKDKYQIIYDRYMRKIWWKFWDKTYEAKVLVHLEEPKEENDKVEIKEKKSDEKEKLNEKPKEKKLNKDVTKEEKDRKKAELIRMLNEPQGLHEMVKSAEAQGEEVSKTISDLKLMVETLVQKFEEENETRKKKLPLELEKMESYLREQEIDGRTARIYVEKVEEELKEIEVLEETIVHENVRKMIENRLKVKGPMDIEKEKIIALVGPTGVGKTTTLAKIGWELTKKGRTVGFITTDSFRSGAKEQLKGYGELMDAETIQAKGVKELQSALQYFQNANQVDHILIDTVGRNPMEEETVGFVSEYLKVAEPTTTALVMSATSKVKDMKEILSRFDSAKIDAMIFTKLDETYNIGSVLNVFNFTKLPLLFVTDGQEITKNIYAPSKNVLAEKVLKKEAKIEGGLIAEKVENEETIAG